MPKYGFTLYCEGFDPRTLVTQAIAAEQAGFDFLVISDHFHPWLPEQEHSGFAWSILGAIAQATSTIELATMVTCPIMRYHPAIIAQAAATIGVLSEGRFTLGVGTGERLNEHIVGEGWSSYSVRQEKMHEAVEIIRRLWTGETETFEGEHFRLDSARIFDLPEEPLTLYMAAGGPSSAALAAEIADGICMTEPNKEIVDVYARHGGSQKNIWAQLVSSYAPTEDEGLRLAYTTFRFALAGWPVQAELPNPSNFGAVTKAYRAEDLASSMPAGSDPKKHAAFVKKFLDLGVTHLALAYPGQDLEGYLRFWQQELRPLLP